MILVEILEIIDEELFLDEEELQDSDIVKDELLYIAEDNDDIRAWINEVGINTAVKCVIEYKKNPSDGIEKYINLMLRIMKEQGSSDEEMIKCVNSIYEQYEVPEEYRKDFFKQKEKE